MKNPLLHNNRLKERIIAFLPYADTLLYAEVVFIAFGSAFLFGKTAAAVISIGMFATVTVLVLGVYYKARYSRLLQLAVFDLHMPYQLAVILAIAVYRDMNLVSLLILAVRIPFAAYELLCIFILTETIRTQKNIPAKKTTN